MHGLRNSLPHGDATWGKSHRFGWPLVRVRMVAPGSESDFVKFGSALGEVTAGHPSAQELSGLILSMMRRTRL